MPSTLSSLLSHLSSILFGPAPPSQTSKQSLLNFNTLTQGDLVDLVLDGVVCKRYKDVGSIERYNISELDNCHVRGIVIEIPTVGNGKIMMLRSYYVQANTPRPLTLNRPIFIDEVTEIKYVCNVGSHGTYGDDLTQ